MKTYDLCEITGALTVCCNTIHTDLHPPSNLADRRHNSKGFMAEYYIRPPVSINLHLPFPMTLVGVSADTKIGNQTSTLVQVAGSTARKVPCSQYCKQRSKTHQPQKKRRKHSSHKNNSDSSPDSPEVEEDVADFHILGKGSAVNDRVVFSNFANLSDPTGHLLKDEWKFRVLDKMSVLQLTILKTHESSVPCLRNLQILVKSNTKADEEYLENLMKTNVAPSAPFNFFGGEDTTVPELVSRESSSLQIEEELSAPVPQEFLDDITNEIMLLPMILPSGKVVDRSTIEKCNAAQAVYGALARDPFSGTIYTSSLKPVFNANLKSRIDNYLLENKMATRGQTLGDSAIIETFLSRQMKRKVDCSF